jgi:anti-sigma factor RsiW
MKFETEIKLQAYLDGELVADEAKQVMRALELDAEARALYQELQWAKELLSGNELELKVPETREFYWSKIQREILRQREEGKVREKNSSVPWWLRIAAPLAGAVALVMLVISANLKSDSKLEQRYVQEIESPLQESSVISFYSQSAGMTVVWLRTQ